MKKIFAKIITVLMALTISCASLPLYAFATETKGQDNNNGGANALSQVNNLGYIELSDGYVSAKSEYFLNSLYFYNFFFFIVSQYCFAACSVLLSPKL